MKTITWTRESHGLFDYESKSIKKKYLNAHDGGVLVRRGDSIDFQTEMPEESDLSETDTVLFSLTQDATRRGKSNDL